MDNTFRFVIPALMGVESTVAYELKKLGLSQVKAENGRVLCQGGPADIPRMNLALRCGARVLLSLGSFQARSFEELFQGAAAIPWEDYIPREGRFPVKGYSISSQLHSVPACQSILKKALSKRLGQVYGLDTLPETGSLYQVQFSILKDTVTLMLDTSGDSLYKRGYRAQNMGAPLRETLAAALVSLSRYKGRDPFCDPFCGSGTIPIEAALIAKNRAPGLNRNFAAQRWGWLPSRLWMDADDEAQDAEFHGSYDIWGGDIDPAAVELSRHNARLAGVEDTVRFQVADAAGFRRTEPAGRVVTNPPYGERLLEKEEAEGLYRAFGKAARALPKGWEVDVLSSHTEFERAFGRPADKKRKLYNGMIKCDLFMYGGKR
ncbi:MAG: class I SAM-dependent RNA methyltransferase [Oscillospiraceae bacterium]|nr:class I SAM-dependent RNA methyltransferase [Oscillospiraceae bacterium]